MARVEARCVPPLKAVEGAVSFAALGDNPPKHRQPMAWVIPIGDSGGANRVATGVIQRVTDRVGVVLALGNLADRRGAAASQTVETVKESVRTALAGWQPTADHTALIFRQGRALRLDNGVVWWLDEFEAAHFQRAV